MEDTFEEFRDIVQRYLRASGYSQEQLADALGLHPKVLSRKLNSSGKARLTHREIQHIILALASWRAIITRDEALALLAAARLDPATFRNEEWSQHPLNTLAVDRSSTSSSDPRTHNLPAPTMRLIGREWAVQRLQHLLQRDDVRLVTLIGAGGSGKTSLALHLARTLVGTFAQGVWFVSLAGLSDPALVPLSILQALKIQLSPGTPVLPGLIEALKNRCLLLILDNFEHIGEARVAVSELLTGIPGLKVLVTSRVVLRLSGEQVWGVPPLDVPDPQHPGDAQELWHYGAVQLFVERAQAALPTFAVTQENSAVIAGICARVDGLPLALELAAVRVKVLSPELLLQRLTQARFPLLTRGASNLPERQRTLHTTITWSYHLLSSAEQIWFRHLAIFLEGFWLEAAEALPQDSEMSLSQHAISSCVLDMLEQLVDNSLLLRLPASDGLVRFHMLEMLREYALEQLDRLGELERLRDWHACYYLREAERVEAGLRSPQQLMWLTRMTADLANYRTALHWLHQKARDGKRIRVVLAEKDSLVAGSRTLSRHNSLETGALASELCLRLAAAVRHYWEWRGYLTEARQWLLTALLIPFKEEEEEETLIAARARALSESSRLLCLENEQMRASELAEESIALWRRLDDPSGLATALMHRGWAAHTLGDYEMAKRLNQEGLQVLSCSQDAWLYGQLLMYLAAAVGFTFDFERMRSLYSQCRVLFEQIGDRCALADVLKDQGGMLLLESRYTEAINSLLASLSLCYELDNKQYITTNLCWLSYAFGLRQKPDPVAASLVTAQLEGTIDRLAEMTGLAGWTKSHPLTQAIFQQIRSQVDEQQWQAAYERGRTLTVEQAIDLAYSLRGE